MHGPSWLVPIPLVAVAVFGCSNTSNTPDGGVDGGSCVAPNLSGGLSMSIEWAMGSGELDIGATTPDGIISANFPGNDPNCTHSGDEDGTSANPLEVMTCFDPPASGNYEIVVDNLTSVPVEFTLTVTVGGTNIPEFFGDEVAGDPSPVTTTIAADSFQEWSAIFCVN